MMAAARNGRMDAMLLMGDHVHYEDGTMGDVAAALDAVGFLVVTDGFLSPIAEKADVVLPASQWAEKQGTYTNIERRVQPLKRVFTNKSVRARSDLEIVCGIAARMGAAGFDYDGPEQVLDEIAGAVPAYGGISYARLLAHVIKVAKPSNDNPQPTQVIYSDEVRIGLQWPCTSATDDGTPVLYADGFRHGKARLGELAWHPRPAHDDRRFPLLLAHGRVLAQPGRPTKVADDGKLHRIERDEELVLHPADARRLGLADGQRATATTAGGNARAGIVRVSEEVLPSVEELRGYEALVVLTGFGEIMARQEGEPYPVPEVGAYHVPHFTLGAAERIVASGLKLVAIDSTTVEPQTSQDPVRFGSDVHFKLLGNEPPVLIVEGLSGGGLAEKVGFVPREGLLHIVPRRVNEKGAEAAHCRAFLYFYRDDPAGEGLRRLAEQMQPEELYG